jgi:hypothetical protein
MASKAIIDMALKEERSPAPYLSLLPSELSWTTGQHMLWRGLLTFNEKFSK